MTQDWRSFHGVFDEVEYAQIFPGTYSLQTPRMQLNYTLSERSIFSGPGASFGGLTFYSDLVHHPRLLPLIDALDELKSALRDRHCDARYLTLRLAPDVFYSPEFAGALRTVFESTGARSIGEVTHIISKTDWQPKSTVRRNAKKAERAGLVVRNINPQLCHEKLSEFKAAKNYAFGFQSDLLCKQFELFGEVFGCFASFAPDGNICAAILEARIGETVILIAWDQDEFGKKHAAVDYLLLSRIESAFSGGFRFVDMGTVSDRGRQINAGLARHKENFAATPFLRNTYQLDLTEND